MIGAQSIILLVLVIALFALIWTRRVTLGGTTNLVNLLNSKGGNLLLLGILSLWFFYAAMEFSYHLLEMMTKKEITPDNAVALSTFSFLTGTAFGGAFGALLKGMSGEAETGHVTKTEATTTQTIVETPPPAETSESNPPKEKP